MGVQLEAIKFNHDPTSVTADALNIRRNATTFVTVPEWRRGVSATPDDSPVCFSITDTASHTLTIQASFTRTDGQLKQAEIRAVEPNVAVERDGCLGALRRIIGALVRALVGNVLGEVKARMVTFDRAGETGFQSFELVNPRLWRAGVGVRTTTWQWQYRRQPSDGWTDFATTQHKVYSILRMPTAPWQQTPYAATNTQLPWTDALEYACSWAILKTNLDDAATAITRQIFDLGPATIEYDCPGGGSTNYGGDLTAFLDVVGGGLGNGRYVNCSDCATFVSTLANLLGCDLWQSRMGAFDLNPILAIGSSTWQTPCHAEGWLDGFSYHEVAWKSDCTADDNIFDACLKVDGDADPTTPPHTPLLVANLRFGHPGDGNYRDRVATPAARAGCEPDPTSRVRRTLS